MKRIVANKIKKGTRRANVGEGVAIKSHAPKPPPITLVTPSRARIKELSFISRLKPNKPANKPGHSATVRMRVSLKEKARQRMETTIEPGQFREFLQVSAN